MKAVLLSAVDVMTLQEVEKPELSRHKDMRVRLHAAGVNPIDAKMRVNSQLNFDVPKILGCDGAGVVESIGDKVHNFKIGDEVYFFNGGMGTTEQGNYAEYTTINHHYAALKPKNISMTEAAAIPLAWITAWEALVERAHLQFDQTILIHAGAGGVGHLAIQLAKSLGARVAVTVSNPKKKRLAQLLGADYCIDYTKNDFVEEIMYWTNGKGVNVVLDTVGGDIFCDSVPAIKIYGKIVTLLDPICNQEAAKIAKRRNLSLIYELMLTPLLEHMHDERVIQRLMLERATRLIEADKLIVQITQILPLAQAAKAHQIIEEGHTTGKIVLTI